MNDDEAGLPDGEAGLVASTPASRASAARSAFVSSVLPSSSATIASQKRRSEAKQPGRSGAALRAGRRQTRRATSESFDEPAATNCDACSDRRPRA